MLPLRLSPQALTLLQAAVSCFLVLQPLFIEDAFGWGSAQFSVMMTAYILGMAVTQVRQPAKPLPFPKPHPSQGLPSTRSLTLSPHRHPSISLRPPADLPKISLRSPAISHRSPSDFFDLPQISRRPPSISLIPPSNLPRSPSDLPQTSLVWPPLPAFT